MIGEQSLERGTGAAPVADPPAGGRRGGLTVDGVAAGILLVVGVVYLVAALQAGVGSMAETGSGFFPFIVALVLLVAAAIVLASELRGARTVVPADEDDEEFLGDVHWWRIVGVLAVTLMVPLVGGTVGFVVTLSVALVAIAKIMGLQGWRAPVLLGVAFGAVVWLVFVHWLFVPLPTGYLGLV